MSNKRKNSSCLGWVVSWPVLNNMKFIAKLIEAKFDWFGFEQKKKNQLNWFWLNFSSMS